MYTTRTILILLLIAVALLLVSLFLLLVWTQKNDTVVRETTRVERMVDVLPAPSKGVTPTEELPVPQNEGSVPPLGTDLNMEFPIPDEAPPTQ